MGAYKAQHGNRCAVEVDCKCCLEAHKNSPKVGNAPRRAQSCRCWTSANDAAATIRKGRQNGSFRRILDAHSIRGFHHGFYHLLQREGEYLRRFSYAWHNLERERRRCFYRVSRV